MSEGGRKREIRRRFVGGRGGRVKRVLVSGGLKKEKKQEMKERERLGAGLWGGGGA